MNFEEFLSKNRLPQNLDAERAVLGACLLMDVIGPISGWLQPDHFYLDTHRKIYRAMIGMWGEGQPIEYITLGDALDRTGDLDAIGGHAYLTTLTDGLPRGINLQHYAEIVVEKAKARRVIEMALDAAREALQGSEVSEVVQSLSRGAESVVSMGKRSMSTGPLLLPAHKFIAQAPERIDWLVEGIIPRGAMGFLVADPKGGKSWAGADLALALATCTPWLGFKVPRPARVALISREDPQSLTGWRMGRLMRGRGLEIDEYLGELWCNSRSQSPSLNLLVRNEVAELTAELQSKRPDIVIFDVFNVMHDADENDNKEMRAVIQVVAKISLDCGGCAVCIAHHFNKTVEGSLVRRMRGSSAIAGAAQWLVGLKLVDEAQKIRQAEFELKAAESPEPFSFRVHSDDSARTSRIVPADYAAAAPAPRAMRTAAGVLEGLPPWNRN